jgi:hypothetical protein
MFFRRIAPKTLSFEDRLDKLRAAGFTVTLLSAGHVRVSRGVCATVIEDLTGAAPRVVECAGLISGDAIASLVDSGFQKFFQTPAGKRQPALAEELKAVHDFEEDLRSTLGAASLYNEALGTVSTFYQYDRVKDRDRGVPKRIWE